MANVTRPPRQEWEIVADDTDRLKVPGGWLYRVIGGRQAMALCSSPTKKKDGSGGLPNSRRPWTGCAAVGVSERPPPTAHLCDVERAPTTPTWLASLEPPMPGPRRGRNCTSIARMLELKF